MPNLRGKCENGSERKRDEVRKAESDKELNFGKIEEVETLNWLEKPRT